VDVNHRGQDGDATNKEKNRTTATTTEKEKVGARAIEWAAVAGGGAGAKTATTEAAVEATAVTGGVDTGAAATLTAAMMVMAKMMTQLNVCDASMEEKESTITAQRRGTNISSGMSSGVVGSRGSGVGWRRGPR
jgi:hypothetical protein